MKPARDFYRQNAVDLARELIGKVLVHNTPEGTVSGVITEAEAYMGSADRAAHAWNHRGKNGRTAVLYKDGGYAYVYLIYGMYYCFNVSANAEGTPECVLIRAAEPLEGAELMMKRRKISDARRLCDGPGKLCMAFGIDIKHYGADLLGEALYIEDTCNKAFFVEASKRVNIDYAGEAKDYLYRFIMRKDKRAEI